MRAFNYALLALVASILLVAMPAGANPFDKAVETRVLPGWRMADGRLMAGIELALAPGWKTYWRAPGDAGIPPLFDWSGSRNLGNAEIAWPTPHVFEQNGMRSIGYKGRMVFPIAIKPKRPGQPVRLSGTIDIGVCKDACVPVQVRIDETLDGTITRPDPFITAALAEQPYSAAEAGLRSVSCEIAAIADGLSLRASFILPSTGGREAAVLETGDPLIWASEPKVTREGSRLTAEFELVNAAGGAFALDRSALRFTVIGQNHAVDIHGCSG